MKATESDHFDLTEHLLSAGRDFAVKIGARAFFACLEAIPDLKLLKDMKLDGPELILVAREKKNINVADNLGFRNILVPPVILTRMGQIKTAVILAFSQRLLDTGDSIVFLVGPSGGGLDTMVVVKVGEEWEMFHTANQPRLTEHIKRVVFQQALTIALELAAEGREGKPVGALFVIGDYRNITQHRQQIILNPFKGYSEKNRNILDESMRETIKNFAALDGAFIIKGNGVIVSAGTHIKGVKPAHPLPQGLGARHAAAAGITSVSKSIAVTISESTGTVRIWRRGQIITEIERSNPNAGKGPLVSAD
jgi:DNA integrity scanning protein DisA with diadenylate cyclase activity